MNALAGWGVIKCWYKRLLHSYEFKSMASLGRLPANGRQKWQKPTYCFWIEYSIVSHNLWYNSMGFSGRTSTKPLNQHQIWQKNTSPISICRTDTWLAFWAVFQLNSSMSLSPSSSSSSLSLITAQTLSSASLPRAIFCRRWGGGDTKRDSN